jgi:hypothetical protein
VAERPLDIELPEGTRAPEGEYADAMSGSDTWLAVDKRYPGSMAAAAKRMAATRAAGADAAEVQVQGQKVIEALLPVLLAEAGPELREGFLALLTAQLAATPRATGAAAGGTGTAGAPAASPAAPLAAPRAAPPACIAVLAADTAARRALPADLVQREAAWLIAAATAAPTREVGGRIASTPETEVLRRRLGERAPALLAQAWQPSALLRPARDCERTAELLRVVAALPPAERRLATRLMFGKS